MKYLVIVIFSAALISSCSSSRKASTTAITETSVQAALDLVNVQNDKVTVTVKPPSLPSGPVTYQLPKIIPGTYAIADYGRYVDNFKALDKSGKSLPVSSPDSNTWVITQTSPLASISYQVSDTYDSEAGDAFEEGSRTIFSPAGTNILAGQNFLLNLCGFVGYFGGKIESPYKLNISHPQNLLAASSMNDEDPSATMDQYTLSRYAEVVDHPIMYSAPDTASATINNMQVLFSVYSPRKKSITADAFFPGMEKMFRAQKAYLGAVNNTKKYAVLTYITSFGKDDAKGTGALEHNTSTTSVFQESLKARDITEVISHEFFHTITPLNIHSYEIQYFDFNKPEMSEHLWLYEGVTEYFANHFQVYEGLITEDKFFSKMAEKEKYSRQMYNDTISFTQMSKNVLQPSMKGQYPNVYLKGALIGMCIDIILRENTGGKSGILELMDRLSKKYGPTKPFADSALIPEITAMTNAELGAFFQNHVIKGKPIDYEFYLKKMGVEMTDIKVPTELVFLADSRPYIMVDTAARKAVAVIYDTKNNFMNAMGVKNGDEIIEMDGTPIDASNLMGVLMTGYGLEEDEPMTMKVKRNGQIVELKGKVKLNYEDGTGFKFTDSSKLKLKEAWLKGTN